jgi:hypothetical protein
MVICANIPHTVLLGVKIWTSIRIRQTRISVSIVALVVNTETYYGITYLVIGCACNAGIF